VENKHVNVNVKCAGVLFLFYFFGSVETSKCEPLLNNNNNPIYKYEMVL